MKNRPLTTFTLLWKLAF